MALLWISELIQLSAQNCAQHVVLTVVEVLELFLFFLTKIKRNATCLLCVCVVSQLDASCNIKENQKEINCSISCILICQYNLTLPSSQMLRPQVEPAQQHLEVLTERRVLK